MTVVAAIFAAVILIFDIWLLRGKSKINKLYLGASLTLPTVLLFAWIYNVFLR
jgi:hypothetical protein